MQEEVSTVVESCARTERIAPQDQRSLENNPSPCKQGRLPPRSHWPASRHILRADSRDSGFVQIPPEQVASGRPKSRGITLLNGVSASEGCDFNRSCGLHRFCRNRRNQRIPERFAV